MKKPKPIELAMLAATLAPNQTPQYAVKVAMDWYNVAVEYVKQSKKNRNGK